MKEIKEHLITFYKFGPVPFLYNLKVTNSANVSNRKFSNAFNDFLSACATKLIEPQEEEKT